MKSSSTSIFMCIPVLLTLLFGAAAAVSSQQADAPIEIRVDTRVVRGAFKPIWAWFGNDEPNYAYMRDGQKLLGELAAASPVPVYFRTHNLLTSGDGTAALKWGSTNVYTEDANGRPVYDWTILDRIIDTYLARKIKPFFQLGFMPEALSSRPQPYRHFWKPGDNYNDIYTGWSYPPTDYAKWGELVYQVGKHVAEKYGRREVDTLVVGSLERTRHRVLARHAGRVHEALRLRGRRAPARAAERENRRTRSHRTERRADSGHPPEFHRALPPRNQLRHRQDRHATRPRHVPRERRTSGNARRSRADERRQSAAGHRQRIHHHRVVSGAQGHPHRHRRIGSRGLRRVPDPDEPLQCVPERHHVLELYRRTARPHIRAGRPARREPAGLGVLGVRVRRPAVLRRLPRSLDQRCRQARAERVPDARPDAGRSCRASTAAARCRSTRCATGA